MQTRRTTTVLASGLLLWGLMEALTHVNLPGQLAYVFAAPVLVGLAAYAGVGNARSRDGWLIGIAATAPLFPILGMGGDPAKPGLEWILYWPFFIGIVVGAFSGWLLEVYVIKRARKDNAQA